MGRPVIVSFRHLEAIQAAPSQGRCDTNGEAVRARQPCSAGQGPAPF